MQQSNSASINHAHCTLQARQMHDRCRMNDKSHNICLLQTRSTGTDRLAKLRCRTGSTAIPPAAGARATARNAYCVATVSSFVIFVSSMTTSSNTRMTAHPARASPPQQAAMAPSHGAQITPVIYFSQARIQQQKIPVLPFMDHHIDK